MSHKASLGLGLLLLATIPLVFIIGFLIFSYNNLVAKEEEVFSAWSQVESNYQRRADLVPNLVQTVRAFADQEIKAIDTVSDARASSLKSLIDKTESVIKTNEVASRSLTEAKKNLNDEQQINNILENQKSAHDALTAMIIMAEAYPDLNSSKSFLILQDQLEGAENRINNARMVFNEKAKAFNSKIRSIPGNLMAGWGGFQRKAYFQSDENSHLAIDIKIDKNSK